MKKNTVICIPSIFRAKKCKRVIHEIRRWNYENYPIVVFTERNELDEYTKVLSDELKYGYLDELKEHPMKWQGIGYSRYMIMLYAKLKGYKYVYMVDDDVWTPHDFNSMMLKMKDNPEYIFIGLHFSILDLYCGDNEIEGGIIKYCDGTQLVLHNVNKILEVGNYDPQLEIYEDRDLQLRLQICGYKFGVDKDVSGRRLNAGEEGGGISETPGGYGIDKKKEMYEYLKWKWGKKYIQWRNFKNGPRVIFMKKRIVGDLNVEDVERMNTFSNEFI